MINRKGKQRIGRHGRGGHKINKCPLFTCIPFPSPSPVPEIRWNKYLEPMPTSAEISMSGAVLRIYNIQFEDEGTYECEAENHRGKDKHSAKVYVQGR